MTKCWICDATADSREHKIKRSDLVRAFGKDKAFREADLIYLRHDGKAVTLRGPNSEHVKYKPVLCAKCNNERTQPFDLAYDVFVEYIETNQVCVLKNRQIDFSHVYGNNWEHSQLQLFRYFAKAFGCRLADAGRDVPRDVRDLLFVAPFQTALWVCLAVDEDELRKSDKHAPTLRIGNIITNEPNRSFAKYTASCWYKWLLVSFWYGWGPYGPVGSKWCADCKCLFLGSYSESLASSPLKNS